MNLPEEEIINQIISLLEERKSRLDSGVINGILSIRELLLLLRDLAFYLKRFEITQVFVSLSLAPKLLNTYFEQNIQISVLKAIDSEKYNIPSDIKYMFRREVHSLNADDHFDSDYIPLLDKLKEDFTTFKEYSERYDIAIKLISLINDCSESIIREINSKVSKFYEETISILKERPSLKTFREKVEEFVKILHREVYGWP